MRYRLTAILFASTALVIAAIPAVDARRARAFSLDGRVVSTVADRLVDARTHPLQWNGEDDFGHRVASGSYFLRGDTVWGPVTLEIVRIE